MTHPVLCQTTMRCSHVVIANGNSDDQGAANSDTTRTPSSFLVAGAAGAPPRHRGIERGRHLGAGAVANRGPAEDAEPHIRVAPQDADRPPRPLKPRPRASSHAESSRRAT